MEELFNEFLKGAVGGLGRYAVPMLLIGSGGLNVAFFWSAVTRPRTARNDIAADLQDIEQAVLDSYDCIKEKRSLSSPKKIEIVSDRVLEKLGFLATIESMKNNRDGYEKIQTAIQSAECLKAFGAFTRTYCDPNSPAKNPGSKYFLALQESSTILQNVQGIPEAISEIRRIVRRKRRLDDNLKDARDAAVVVVGGAFKKGQEDIFLSENAQ